MIRSNLTCMCNVLWTARVLDWQNPFPHSWHLNGFSLEWIYLEANTGVWNQYRKTLPEPRQLQSPPAQISPKISLCAQLNIGAPSPTPTPPFQTVIAIYLRFSSVALSLYECKAEGKQGPISGGVSRNAATSFRDVICVSRLLQNTKALSLKSLSHNKCC